MSQLYKATFVGGKPNMVDYNPGTNTVNAGDVLVFNNSIRIAHNDIPANTLGALSVGGGIYDLANGSNGATVSDGNVVRWDATNQCASTGTNNVKLGEAIGAGSSNNATLRALHVAGIGL